MKLLPVVYEKAKEASGLGVWFLEFPPYSVIAGNPWRIVKFVFTPEEIIEHEALLYPEEQRIPLDVLQRNYENWMEGHR